MQGSVLRMTLHIVATRKFTPYQLEMLRAAAPHAEITDLDARAAQVEQALTPETEILYTGRGNISLERASGLRGVQGEFAGVDHGDGTPIWQSPAVLTSVNGAHVPHTPEYVLSHILAWAYNQDSAASYQKDSTWGSTTHRSLFTPRDLRKQTIGIVGYGAIGRRLRAWPSCLACG